MRGQPMCSKPLIRRWQLLAARLAYLLPALMFLASAQHAAHAADPPHLNLVIDTSRTMGDIDLTRYALGQGGLSSDPMFDAEVPQIAHLHPQTIRIFVLDHFEIYPAHGVYQWAKLDRTIETILATGAKPIMCLAIKPHVLYPKIDQDIVHPTDYQEWEQLIYQLVKHCNEDRKFGIVYWEVGNEGDIGEDGGCPYRFRPDDYVTYYAHTAAAILRADPRARVGGPAAAGYETPIIDALIAQAGAGKIPLHFVSWHMYNSHPEDFRQSIRTIRAKLGKYPVLHLSWAIHNGIDSLESCGGVDPESYEHASVPQRLSKPEHVSRK